MLVFCRIRDLVVDSLETYRECFSVFEWEEPPKPRRVLLYGIAFGLIDNRMWHLMDMASLTERKSLRFMKEVMRYRYDVMVNVRYTDKWESFEGLRQVYAKRPRPFSDTFSSTSALVEK